MMLRNDYFAVVRIPEIDFATTHTYPDAWSDKSPSWTKQWIDDHLFIAKKHNKAFVMEEFGQRDESGEGGNQDLRNQLYDAWTKQICDAGGNWMFWMLGGRQVTQDSDSLNGKVDRVGDLWWSIPLLFYRPCTRTMTITLSTTAMPPVLSRPRDRRCR